MGFDAVVIVGAKPGAALEGMAANLAARPEFAPIVLVLLVDPPQPSPPAVHGVHSLYGRKVDRDKLVRAVRAASEEHRQALAMLRANPAFESRYRFGSTLIRGHRCIRQVGSGGMCKIYLAESERAGSMVVLKVFSQVPDVSERNVSFDRFLQEYEIVAGLKHRNIVQIYDLGVADDHAYIAMEHFFARRPAPAHEGADAEPNRGAAISCEQMASALAAIHEVGVLHRDLKPANVMLRADGSLCLIDFGLAKANETCGASLTGTREIFGTPYYMSPEQGHAELIDARSDLYSLGVIVLLRDVDRFASRLPARRPWKSSISTSESSLTPLAPQLGQS